MKKNYYVKQGAVVAFIVSQARIGMFISQIEGINVTHLIISQILLFLVCFIYWICVEYFIQSLSYYQAWIKSLIALFIGIFLSSFFHFVADLKNYKLDFLVHTSEFLLSFGIIYRGVALWMLMYPVAYYYIENKKMEKERMDMEHLKQQNLLFQLNFLQEQLNPHFLFNSLNVLKSGTKDQWAKNFTVELSSVYRYLLKYNKDEYLVALKPELDFIRSYIHILKERFEDGLFVDINVSESFYEYKIPPLSLQLLIENAVKHNILSLRNPLRIAIFDEAEYLVVRNNIQRKKGISISANGHTGIGLQNLRARYEIIAGADIIVEEHAATFTVKIPLIK